MDDYPAGTVMLCMKDARFWLVSLAVSFGSDALLIVSVLVRSQFCFWKWAVAVQDLIARFDDPLLVFREIRIRDSAD